MYKESRIFILTCGTMIINKIMLERCKYFNSMPQIQFCSAAFRAQSLLLDWLYFCRVMAVHGLSSVSVFFFFFLLPSNRYFIVLGVVSVHVCPLPLSGRERGPISAGGQHTQHRYASIHLRIDTKMHSAWSMGCSALLVLLLSNTQDIKCSILNMNSYKIILSLKRGIYHIT